MSGCSKFKLSIAAAGLAILASCVPTTQSGPQLISDAKVEWSVDQKWFGGLSGAEVIDDGRRMIVVTDRGHYLEADMIRDQGRLTGLRLHRDMPLLDEKQKPLMGEQADSEGVAISKDGRVFISFELDHRIAVLGTGSNENMAYPFPIPDQLTMQDNSGMEALAIHPDGTLYTLPERSGSRSTPFPLWAIYGKKWRQAHDIPRRGSFLAVGADFGPDGLFYLLERSAGPLGFRTRIRRFDLSADDLAEETLLTTFPGKLDNLEAISVWRDKKGTTRLTLVSDDNFLAIQQTQIIEYVLQD